MTHHTTNTAASPTEATPRTSSDTNAIEQRFVAKIPAERVRELIAGEISLAAFAGLSPESLYEIAAAGHNLFTCGRLAEAKRIFQGLVAASPLDSVFHCHLAAAHHRAGELSEAFAEYDLALKFNDSNIDALAGRGELNLGRANLQAALTDLRRAIELDPHGHRQTSIRARALLVTLKQLAANGAQTRQNTTT